MTPQPQPQPFSVAPHLLTLSTASEITDLVQDWKDEGLRVAFVPTMGALHAGHLSLIKLALAEADRCVVSIFVNPTQFAPHEDFDSYPRDSETDTALLEEIGVHALYLPSESEIYPDGDRASDVEAGAAATGLESDSRPHFFNGVVNVVSRLFDQVQPDMAIFGEKDYQQLCVIREMVEALDMPIEIIGAPIARGDGGLALSSRNAYLSEDALKTARYLNKVLFSLVEEIREYPDEVDDLIPAAIQSLYEAGFETVDYLELRDGRLLAAAWIGKTRLIDNVAAS